VAVRRGPIVTALLATAVTLAAGCGGAAEFSSSQALAASLPVSFTTADGVRLEGRLFGPGDGSAGPGVVLAHMLPADQSSWFAEAIRLSNAGYRVLTFNFRGYCPGGDLGCSEGDRDPGATAVDLAAAVDELQGTGVDRVGLVGASMGGTASLSVAAAQPAAIDAVITLSAPISIGGLSVSPDALSAITAASLFIAGTGDATAAQAAQTLYDGANQPKSVQILPSDDHGTDLLTGNATSAVRGLIDGWLASYLPLGASPTA
jgi:dienelactone hydrolase